MRTIKAVMMPHILKKKKKVTLLIIFYKPFSGFVNISVILSHFLLARYTQKDWEIWMMLRGDFGMIIQMQMSTVM